MENFKVYDKYCGRVVWSRDVDGLVKPICCVNLKLGETFPCQYNAVTANTCPNFKVLRGKISFVNKIKRGEYDVPVNKPRCPICGEGFLAERIFPKYRTRIEGITVYIANAKIRECSSCGERIHDPAETKKWKKQFEKSQQDIS